MSENNAGEDEIWKGIPGFEDYEVSNKGKARNIKSKRTMKIDSKGAVHVWKDGKGYSFGIKKLLRLLFPQMTTEIWKPISGYEEFYEVSDMGRIRNKNTSYILNGFSTDGYVSVSLAYKQKIVRRSVHRLVAHEFIPKSDPSFDVVNHINGKRNDNRAQNLEWTTSAGNSQHAVDTGLLDLKNRKNNSRKRPIIQIDKKTEMIVNVFDSIVDASFITGIKPHVVQRACSHKSEEGEYIWEYIKDPIYYLELFSENMPGEIWKPYKTTKYLVSTHGRVMCSNPPKILRVCMRLDGRCAIVINGKTALVHRMVAETFLENTQNLPEVDHINGNCGDNNVKNLRWVSGLQNKRLANNKKVIQFDMNRILIKKWDSIIDASKSLKIDASSITKCCKGNNRHVGNFIWQYDE
jgi:hypothetical protein